VLGAAAYALVLLVVERRLFPADVRLLLGVVRRQRPVSDASG
jgi:hypothetical protein